MTKPGTRIIKLRLPVETADWLAEQAKKTQRMGSAQTNQGNVVVRALAEYRKKGK